MSHKHKSYNLISIMLHWIIAALFFYLFYMAWTMTAMEASDQKWQLYDQHKEFGFLVGILVVFRIIWKMTTKAPLEPEGIVKWQKVLAKLTHFLFYLVMILFPLSGYMMSMSGAHGLDFFGLDIIDVVGESDRISDVTHIIHSWLEYATYILISIHVSAVIYHHYILKNDTFRNMVFTRRIK